MEATIIEHIVFEPDVEALAKKLHAGSAIDELRTLVEQAAAIARPRALYGVAYIEERGDDYVIIDGVRFSSRVLRVNLEQAHRVFPYLATAGGELEQWANSLDDVLLRFWADTIYESALRPAMQALDAAIDERYRPGHTSRMNPGSLKDWPIEQQAQLFALFGDTRSSIGVELTDSFLMLPRKSVSGLRFPMEAQFESCQLCPRDGCPGRRAPYDAALYDAKYRQS
ncbi:MAG: vitamin B12 dependent-methionine synthase activation domain-containing protein [Anaerolineae bacterium]